MEIGSKLAIHKLKLIEPKNGTPFYNCVVFEKVYNQSKNLGGKWETAFYNVYILDTSMELEVADRSLGVDEKDKFSFKNIANPDKSVFRVMDFRFENHTVWDKEGKKQVRDDRGEIKTKNIFYITKIERNKAVWHTKDYYINQLEKKVEILEEKLKNRPKESPKGNKKVIKESKKAVLTAKTAVPSHQIEKLKRVIEREKSKSNNLKNELKEARMQAGVYKRKFTLIENKFNTVQQKLAEKQKEIIEVKKMKKEEVIKNAETFDYDFDDIEL